jgi:hypothetical protein
LGRECPRQSPVYQRGILDIPNWRSVAGFASRLWKLEKHTPSLQSFFAFIACATAGRALLQAMCGRDLQANPGIAVQLQSVELLYTYSFIAQFAQAPGVSLRLLTVRVS